MLPTTMLECKNVSVKPKKLWNQGHLEKIISVNSMYIHWNNLIKEDLLGPGLASMLPDFGSSIRLKLKA